jgi:hypothetical protein
MPNGNSIKKQTEEMLKARKKMDRVAEQFKADCSHVSNGEPAFIPSNEPRREGELAYVCKNCHKRIVISKISEEDITKACDIIDRAIDTIKITANPNSEDTEKLLERLSKVQFRVRNEIVPAYMASLKKNTIGRRNDNRSVDESNSAWGKPVINR